MNLRLSISLAAMLLAGTLHAQSFGNQSYPTPKPEYYPPAGAYPPMQPGANTPPPAPDSDDYRDGQPVGSIDFFVEPLSRYGRWIDSRWGRAWTPNVDRDWRPYTIGHWQDGPYGATWRSDEPFGWATYHYGRWSFDERIGWLWVPDTVWGPGWVAWRDSDDVTGWAPLPPQVTVDFAIGGGFDAWSYDRWYAPSWVYVPRPYLYGRSLNRVILPYGRNRDYWNGTRGFTRYGYSGGRVINRSFGHDGHDRSGGRWNGAPPSRRGQPGDRVPGRDGDRPPSDPRSPGSTWHGQPYGGQINGEQPGRGRPGRGQPGRGQPDPLGHDPAQDGRAGRGGQPANTVPPPAATPLRIDRRYGHGLPPPGGQPVPRPAPSSAPQRAGGQPMTSAPRPAGPPPAAQPAPRQAAPAGRPEPRHQPNERTP